MKKIYRSVIAAGLLGGVLVMSGCSAAHTAIKKRNLDVQTRMSETIFLEPMAPSKRIVYVEIRNTSDKEMEVKTLVENALLKKGYMLTDNPEAAYYMLQANVLQVGKTDLRSSREALDGGFGGVIAGVGSAYVISGANKDVAAAGLIGAALGVVGDALVEDTYFSMITDIQLRERPSIGEKVIQSQSSSLRQGTSTTVSQNVTPVLSDWKTYKTRIVSTANKVNLDFDEAQPVLQEALSKSLSGLF